MKRRNSGGGNQGHAEVIPLNGKALSPRNTPIQFDGSYATPPPLTPPYGWRMQESRAGAGWMLVHDREQWSVISWLIQERRAGGRSRSYEALAAELQEDGVPAPTGGRSIGRWHGERVRGLIQRYAPELAAPPRAERGSRLAQLWDRDEDTLTEEEKAELEDLERAAFESYDAEHAADE